MTPYDRTMELDLLRALSANLLSPAVLFFALGIVAALLRTDLKFPEALYVTLTIYLLTALGFKGGVAIHKAGIGTVLLPALAAMLLGCLIPLWTYPILRFGGKLRPVDAAALAAHYGSVSAVTFITATNYLKGVNEPYESYATAFLAVMESPAIIVGVVLGKWTLDRQSSLFTTSLRDVLHEAVFGRSVFLLVGALIIGALCGKSGMDKVEAFFVTPFQGVLALFLLEMGMVTGQRLGDLKKVGPFLVAFGLVMPILNGYLGVVLGSSVGLSIGGATLLGTLAASASYIAAPAAIRLSLPEANPALYLTSSLVITFPFNVTIGIPLFYAMARNHLN
ncbi:MAG: sodium-dependent bicarbonate transport family permease [Verrucomicrobiales bacterium]|nr:sodium-dependent bicarbonate transport family permease [Verrucomicrobiales bacterium]